MRIVRLIEFNRS